MSQRCQQCRQAMVPAETAHDLVERREALMLEVHRIDARLRELDGRKTAGHPSLKGTP